MRELESEIQKQKQEKETLRQAIREDSQRRKMEDPEYLVPKDLQFLSALAKQSKEKKKNGKKILTFEKKVCYILKRAQNGSVLSQQSLI